MSQKPRPPKVGEYRICKHCGGSIGNGDVGSCRIPNSAALNPPTHGDQIIVPRRALANLCMVLDEHAGSPLYRVNEEEITHFRDYLKGLLE